jgi:uncharacterized protein YlxP (DUF503 family)
LAVVGLLTLEIVVPDAQSLKEKRHVVRSVKDRLRNRFHLSVAETDYLDSWQRAQLSVVAVGSDYAVVDSVLRRAEADAEEQLGGALAGSNIEQLL